VLQFDEDAGMEIKSSGSLTAVGTDTHTIVFTGAQQSQGYWRRCEKVGPSGQ